jgi:amino acid permease
MKYLFKISIIFLIWMSRLNTLTRLELSKSVGFFAGFCLLFNQMTGPAVPFTPATFQSPGWLVTSLCYILFCVTSGFSMLFLIESMQAIPGNQHFQVDIISELRASLNFQLS